MKLFCTFLLFFSVLTINNYCQEINVPVVPYPQVVSQTEGSFSLPAKKIKIILSGQESKANSFSAGLLKQTLKDFNRIEAEITEGNIEKGAIVLSLINAPKFTESKSPAESNEEGYVLSVSKDGILIRSVSPKGLLYGTMSLIQMLEKSGSKNSLKCMQISDWPDMKFRGISDDISRGQVPTVENFKKIIRFMARYKMNVYMPYLEDMIKFDSYPSIGIDRGALTKEEVKEIVSYAKNYYIDVIPAFQTLGHYENILSQPEFLKYAEFPGAASLCVSYDSTYSFLETLLKEVCELFPSEYFNMGADESYDVGLGKSKFMVDRSSLAMVHLDHYKKVYSILKKFNKKVMMYGDIILSHPEILEGLPKDITVVDWHYRADYDYPSTSIFQKSGIPYIVSPSVWNYTSTFPVNVNAIPNIKYITGSGLKNSSVGMINSNWGDFGSETLKELLYYGYAWGAQCAWNFDQSRESKFTKDFMSDFFGTDDPRLVSLYETLNSTLVQTTWNELFRHPVLPLRDPAWWEARISPAVKMSWMESTLPKALDDIKALKQIVKKNSDHLDLLEFTVKLSSFYSSKLLSQSLLSAKIAELYMKNNKTEADKTTLAYLKTVTESKKDDEKLALPLIDNNISALKSLKEEYKNLWLRYYKKDNLSMIEDKFDRLANYYSETKQQLNDGQLKPAMIQSDWIYCRVNDSTLSKSAKFRKTFTLTDDLKSAYIQFLGDTYARVYINGEYVDQVFVKRSLSLWTEYKRIKFFNVSRYLKKGENTITVEVDNYLSKGFAGFNMIVDIKAGNNSLQVLSDNSWEALDMSTQGGVFSPAVKKDYPFIITAPNFETKRTSWIER